MSYLQYSRCRKAHQRWQSRLRIKKQKTASERKTAGEASHFAAVAAVAAVAVAATENRKLTRGQAAAKDTQRITRAQSAAKACPGRV